MLRKFTFVMISTLLVFTVSCASKKKKADGTAGGEEGATISEESFTFNPQGSDSGQIQGLSTIHFNYDSSTLSAEARGLLSDNAKWMNEHSSLTIQIEGHCDSRGSVEYNLALGERRAKAVKDYLVNLGVDSKRLTVISYGKEKLLDLADTEAAAAKNRRANFVPLAN